MDFKLNQQSIVDKLTEEDILSFLPKRIKAAALDKITYAIQCVCDQMIHLVIEFDDKLDLNYFAKAIKLVPLIEPILVSNFVTTKRKGFWRIKNDFKFDELWSSVKTASFEEDLRQYVFESRDLRFDLPTHIRIFRLDTKDILVLKATHAAMDAAGMQDYLSLLVKLYNKILRKETFHLDLYSKKKYDRSLKQILRKISLADRIKARKRDKTPEETWAFPWHDILIKNKNYSLLRIPEKRFLRIKDYARKRKVSINDVLLAAYYRAMFKICKPTPCIPMTNAVTINMRRYLPSNKAKSLCNLSTSVFTAIPFIPRATFEETLLMINKHMNHKKERLPGVGLSAIIETTSILANFRTLRKFSEDLISNNLAEKKTHPIFTNIGIINGKEMTFENLTIMDAYFITPIVNAPGFILGMSTYNNCLTISIGFYEGSYDKKTIDYFLELMLGELPQ